MAELAEIESLLVATIAQFVYPDGTAAESIIGAKTRIFRGWPIPEGLDADLKAGIVNISVFPLAMERNVTRNSLDWQELDSARPNMTLTAAGNTITVGGRVGSPLNAAILIDGKAFIYPVQASDTLTSIATALAILIGNGASSLGPVVTISGSHRLESRVGVIGNIVQEIRRQVKSFRITFWCPNPALRDRVAAVVDPALASLSFLSLPDGTGGRIRYERTHTDDGSQKAGLYRRDLDYSVEYATTNVTFAAAIVAMETNINQ